MGLLDGFGKSKLSLSLANKGPARPKTVSRSKLMDKMAGHAMKGHSAAFKYRENAIKYLKMLKESGYHNVEVFRSSGPTIDAPHEGRVIHAYYVARR